MKVAQLPQCATALTPDSRHNPVFGNTKMQESAGKSVTWPLQVSVSLYSLLYNIVTFLQNEKMRSVSVCS